VKILCISCSPRKRGNTEILLNEVMKGAQECGAETEFLSVLGKNIQPCDGCWGCSKTHKCHIKDDMEEFYTKMLEADGIVFGTPIYFWTITGQGKIIIDRLEPFLFNGQLANKIGGIVAVGGNLGHCNVWALFNALFSDLRMFTTDMVQGFAEGKGAIRKDELAMKDALGLGKMMVSFIKQKLESPFDNRLFIDGVLRNKYEHGLCPIRQ